jgi:hypothetical protein
LIQEDQLNKDQYQMIKTKQNSLSHDINTKTTMTCNEQERTVNDESISIVCVVNWLSKT